MAYQFKASIVRILNTRGDAVGAGFLVSKRHVFTCAHVVAQALQIPTDALEAPVGEVHMDFPLILPNSEKLSGSVILWRPVSMKLKQGTDIAVLEIKTVSPANSQPASLITGEDDLWGHSFRAFGFPEGFNIGEWAGGKIRDKLANGWVVIEADKECAFFAKQGFSGTPVWDNVAKGIVGMIAAVEFQSGIKVGYFIPTEILVETWPEIEKYAKPPCPYRGLLAFREEHAPFFFGRENFVKKLIDAVNKKSLIAVIGPSGSGKSSAIFAGLIHSIRKDPKWLIASFHPGKRPLDNLAFKLIPLMEPQMNEGDIWIKGREFAEMFRNEKDAFQDFVGMILEKDTSATSLLLVADQFEELFTLCQDEQERNLFLDRLLATVLSGTNKPGSGLVLLFTMRTDFLNHALLYKNLAEAMQYDVLTLGPMNYQEQKDAIVKPAQKLNVKIEDGLTERILKAVSQEPGNLPLLEFALTQMWDKQINGKLSHTAYDEIGGVEKALTCYAEDEYGKLNIQEQQRIHRIFIQLVHPGEGTEDTRRLATRAEVGEGNWDLVTQLASARMVVTDRDKVTGEETVEIVHEALIKGWDRLHGWMEEDRIFRSWQERLRLQMHQWEIKKRDEGALLRGSLLADAEDWLQKRPLDLSRPEQAFIRTSRSVSKRRQRHKTIGISIGLTVVFIFAVLAVAGWRHAVKERNYAEKQRQVAIARQLIARAELTRNQQPHLLPFSALLAVEAMKRSPSLEADQALRHSLAMLPRRIAQLKHNGAVTAAVFSPDKRYLATVCKDQTTRIWDINNYKPINTIKHQLPVNMVAFSLDGRSLAVASSDNEIIRIFRVTDGEEITRMKHNDNLTGISFNPDGIYLATASWDHTARIWEAETGKKLFTLGHDNKVTGIAFSPNGRYLGTASWDHTARIWDVENGKEILRLEHGNRVTCIAFSPSGKHVGTASWDNTARIWDVENGEEILRLEHGNKVTGIIFSPNGEYAGTASWDNTARVWDAENGEEKCRIRHTDNLNAFIFSPDNQYLVTACKDDTARMWEVRSGKEVIRMSHADEVNTVVFSPDGRYLATGGGDNIAQIWEASSLYMENRIVHDDEVTTAIFSQDGRYLTTVSKDRTAGLWDAKNLQKIATLRHRWEISDVSFSPDGKLLATAGDDGILRLWEIKNSREAGRLEHQDAVKKAVFSKDGRYLATLCENHTHHIWDMTNGEKIKDVVIKCALNDLEFSPDGRFIATACRDNIARLWDVKEDKLITQMPHSDEVTSITFSPDGRFIATACKDNMARLWELKENKLITQMPHTDEVTSITFSPDGRYIATASSDRMARLWDVKEDKLITQMPHTDEVTSITFSPDGVYLATGSRDRMARLWDMREGKIINQIEHADAVLSIAFSPDGRYLATACSDRSARLWDLRSLNKADRNKTARIRAGNGCPQIACMRHDWQITNAVFSPDGKSLATAGKDHTVYIWETANPYEVYRIKHKESVNDLAFSHDGKYIVTACADGRSRVYDSTNYKEIVHKRHEASVNALAISPKENYVATVGGDGRAKVWNVSNGKEITRITFDPGIYSITFSPHGEYLAAVHEDRTVRIWDVTNWKKVSSIKNRDYILAIAISPDLKYLATADDDKTLQVWDLGAGKKIASMKHMKKINAIKFSKDGRYISSACEDRAAHVWEIATGKEIARLNHEQNVYNVIFDTSGRYVITASSDHTARKWLWHPNDMIMEACANLYRNLTSEEWLQYFGNESYCRTCPDLP